MAAAHGAGGRQPIGRLQRRGAGGVVEQITRQHRLHRAAVQYHADHFGNHIPCTAHADGIADPHIFTLQLVFVVQRGIGDGHPPDKHRLQPCHGGECAGSADLHVDGFDHGQGFFGGEFMRNSKTRGAGYKAQPRLVGQRINLIHHAINLIRQGWARGLHLGKKRQQPRPALYHGTFSRHGEAQCRQPIQHRAVGLWQGHAFYTGHAIGKKTQAAFGSQARIQQPQTACGGIARISVAFLGAGILLGVELGEVGFLHQHFTPYFEPSRWGGSLEAQRHTAEGAEIGGDVFAGLAIATGRAQRKHAGLIHQADRQAIKFGLNRIVDRGGGFGFV